jgi:molybdopterin synthase catalytic subunit
MPANTSQDQIGLSARSLSVEKAVALVTDVGAGGIAVFLGTTRGETNSSGQSLLALDYECYAEMAQAQLIELASQARNQWPIVRLALLHRTGRVPVGEPSVIIAVATPHRAEAFAACQWLIDKLKSDAAIWKKEVWVDGSSTWVHPHL